MTLSLGVIGLGRMAQALLLPLLEQGDPAATDVVAVVGQQTSADRLAQTMPNGLTIVPSSDARAAEAWKAPVQLLAIKPYQLDQVASMAPPVQGHEPSLLISVLAGVTLERLQRAFPGRVCVRAVPNTPSLVRAGLTGLAWGEGVNACPLSRPS